MIKSSTFIVTHKDKIYGKSTECLHLNIKNGLSSNMAPLADTLLTKTPGHGSSNMIRMRKLVNDVRFNTNSADAEGDALVISHS